jgi:hypothetical protein
MPCADHNLPSVPYGVNPVPAGQAQLRCSECGRWKILVPKEDRLRCRRELALGSKRTCSRWATGEDGLCSQHAGVRW